MSGETYFSHAIAALGDAVNRDDLVELCINADGSVWVEFRGDHHMKVADKKIPAATVKILGESIAGLAKHTIGKEKPLVSASVEYRGRHIRAQVVVQPAALGGTVISMRFFTTMPLKDIKLDYLHGKEFSLDEERTKRNQNLKEIVKKGSLEDALKFCVDEKLNTLISGGTSTGKTVALRKIMHMIPPEERIVTIEDAAELMPEQPNKVCLIADRNSKNRSPDELLVSTLRMRPDRLIVGEVRGKEAMTFLEAINTGHGGSMTTLHAETPELAIDRLAMAAGRSDVPMTYADMKDYIRRSIDVIIQTGRADGRRGITEFYLPVMEA